MCVLQCVEFVRTIRLTSETMCYSVLQCVAVSFSVYYSNVLHPCVRHPSLSTQSVAVGCSVLQCVAMFCFLLQCTVVCYSVLHLCDASVCCSVL